jgi:hypothetical protein
MWEHQGKRKREAAKGFFLGKKGAQVATSQGKKMRNRQI